MHEFIIQEFFSAWSSNELRFDVIKRVCEDEKKYNKNNTFKIITTWHFPPAESHVRPLDYDAN